MATPGDYFPFEHSHLRAYRWNEDGLAGICDRHQRICFAPAFWNGHDPILKERLFGLTGKQGNHGEDVKEYYFYLDNTPTHSYAKCLYKYPQAEFPYARLVEENARRTRNDPEFELLDTGIFAENRYFDIVIEYAKAAPDTILVRIEAFNRGPETATLHVLPTLWFRNRWTWGYTRERGILRAIAPGQVAVEEPYYGRRWLLAEDAPELLFTENESDAMALWKTPNRERFVKDGIGRYVVQGERGTVNPERTGSKAAAHYIWNIEPGQSAIARLVLTDTVPTGSLEETFGAPFEQTFADRIREDRRTNVLALRLPSEPHPPPSPGKTAKVHGGAGCRRDCGVSPRACQGRQWSLGSRLSPPSPIVPTQPEKRRGPREARGPLSIRKVRLFLAFEFFEPAGIPFIERQVAVVHFECQ